MTIDSMVKLNNGADIPRLGLGTYLSKPGEETYNAVKFGLEHGYRHIDTAAFYKNEVDVGQAVRDSGLDRKDVFVTTKLWNDDQGYDNALKAFDASFNKLNLGYMDLYLIHWPLTGLRKESWKALERIYDEKLTRAIGVSNYTTQHIDELFTYANIPPVVNQVEFSTFLHQKDLLEHNMKNGIYIQAYSPITRGKKLDNPLLISIAEKYGKTPAQILIKWCLQVDTIVLPKSVNEKRIVENADIYDFDISSEDMLALEVLNENFRTCWDPSNEK
jgi:diketogulonate reductase-like aldo/keto reductase